MQFVISCTDKAGHMNLRQETRPAHLDYIKARQDQVIIGGPTITEDGDAMTGSVLIIEADDYAAAEAFAKGDPYAQAGLFDTVSIRPWKKVFPLAG